MNSAAIRELKLNDGSVEFQDNMKIVRRSDGTGKFEKIIFCRPKNLFIIFFFQINLSASGLLREGYAFIKDWVLIGW